MSFQSLELLRRCTESHLIRTMPPKVVISFVVLGCINKLMLMLTPANIFKTGYIFFLPSILTPSSPHTKFFFEVSSVKFLNLDDIYCDKGSVKYSYTLTGQVRCIIIKAGKHGIHWCQFELVREYKIISHIHPVIPPQMIKNNILKFP